MATLYENYITGDDNVTHIHSTNWTAQTFTPSVNHIVTSVKLKLYKVGSPSILTVSIRATSSGLPTGSDLASGTYDSSTLGSSPGAFVEIIFTEGKLVLSGTKYAIVCKITTPDGDMVAWRYDSTGSYSGGTRCNSGDGSSWTAQSGHDFMFEEYGDPQGSGVGGAIFPINPLLRASGIVRTFWAGVGGQSVYQTVITMGGLSTAYVSPIGERQPPSAVTSSVMSLEDYKALRERALRGELSGLELEAYKKVREQALSGVYNQPPPET